MTGRLQFNPEPIREVDAAVRDVWFKRQGWRCDHEDGRGRCTSRETRSLLLSREPVTVASYCDRHFPSQETGQP